MSILELRVFAAAAAAQQSAQVVLVQLPVQEVAVREVVELRVQALPAQVAPVREVVELRVQALPVQVAPVLAGLVQVALVVALLVALLAVAAHLALPALGVEPAFLRVPVVAAWILRSVTPWSAESAASTPTPSTPTQPPIHPQVRARAASSYR